MEAELRGRPAFAVVGMKLRVTLGQPNEIPQLWDRFLPRVREIPGVSTSAGLYGVEINFDDATSQFDYIAGAEVDGTPGVPDGMVRVELPAQTYAVIRCTLPTIHDAIQEFYSGWLPNSGHQRAPGPEFEFYDEHFDPEDPNSEMFMYIPVLPQQ